MRTSITQFEILVEFMERNGDLNKPADGPHGRLTNINRWKEVCDVLNIDTTGMPKSVEKWKKVWSDLKNNTKRKAAKINRAACGTGGGPASKLSLTDLEQRVLGLMGSQSVTGLVNILEIGVELPNPLATRESSQQSPTPSIGEIYVKDDKDSNRPGGSGQSTPFEAITLEPAVASPTTHHAQAHTSRRSQRRYSPLTSSPARPRRRIFRHSAQKQRFNAASEQFLSSDSEWRNLAKEFITENKRLREQELQQQANWQRLLDRFTN